MRNKYFLTIAFLLLAGVLCGVAPVRAAVKGDPSLLWQTPLNKSDIENNAYNRCLLIKIVKPGAGLSTRTRQNNYELIANYAADLYAQSVKIGAFLAEEKEEEAQDASSSGKDNETALVEQEVTRRLADIARRINIINSFEAGITMISALQELNSLQSSVYEDFKALDNGRYEYTDDCEVLKK